MSEKVEEDYYWGYLANDVRGWMAHSKYNRICKFTFDETQNDSETLESKENILFWSPDYSYSMRGNAPEGGRWKLKEVTMAKWEEDSLPIDTLPSQDTQQIMKIKREANFLRKVKNKAKSFIQPKKKNRHGQDRFITRKCKNSLKEMHK